jgi:hypothetical protein
MASTYSDLKIELIGTGEQTGTWGTTTNDNFSIAIGEAITGSADVAFSSSDVTLTLTNTNASQTARNLRLNLTGTSGGARNLILGSGCQIEKLYLINNGLADAVTVKNTSGTGIAVPAGKSMFVFNNGTNVVEAVNSAVTLDATTIDTTNLEVTNIKAKDGTASATIANSTGVMTVASSVLTTTDINGGTIDGTTIGGASAAAGNFTTLGATGVATFSAGTVSLPAITTTGDTNTGIFFPAADTIAFTEGGTEAMRITSNAQLSVNTSNWPITSIGNAAGRHLFGGSNSPQIILWNEAAAAANNGSSIYLGARAATSATSWAGGSILGAIVNNTDSLGYLAFSTTNSVGGNIERMRIDSSGNVGIGTASPDALLSVNGIASFGDGAAATPSIANFGDLNTGFWFPAADTIAASTAGTERMRIDSSGNVGIGITSPSSKLDVSGLAKASAFGMNATGGSPATGIAAPASDTLGFYTNTIERMRIDSSGNVGIGTGSPSTKLTVVGAMNFGANVSAPSVDAGIFRPADGTLAFVANASERMRIDSSGNVGINTTSPGVKLGVVDTSAGAATFPAIFGNRGTTVGTQVNFGLQTYDSGSAGITNAISSVTTSATSGAGSADMLFLTTASGTRAERMRIDSSGNVGIGTSSPQFGVDLRRGSGANAYFLAAGNNNGTTNGILFGQDTTGLSLIWQYGANPITFWTNSSERARIPAAGGFQSVGSISVGNATPTTSGAGITFPATQSASSDANTLDDYEEGTWTPALQGSSTAGTYTYDTDRTGGNYTKIGNTVYIRGVIRVSGTSSAGSGNAQITGLPFPTINIDTSWNRIPGNVMLQAGPTLANSSIFVNTEGASTTYLGVGIQGTATWTAATVAQVATTDAIWAFEIQYNVS